jgi:hypothetical protein
MRKFTPIAACLAALILWIPLAHARAEINDVYVVHFVVDGTNLKAFNDALADGYMPTIKERFVDEGASFEEGLSAFPSTSTSLYHAYSTVLWPGHAGIPHLERFDRQSKKVIGYLTTSGYLKINTDLINLRALTNPDVARIQPPTTIFELLEGWPTVVTYSSFSRGATDRIPSKAPIGALWATYVSEDVSNVDVLAFKNVMKIFEGKIDEIPRYTLVGLYSSDITAHKYGPQSKEVKEILMQFDVFMGFFLKLLEERGIAEKTYIIVTADHGMHETGKLFKFRDALKERGWTLKSSPPPNRDYTIYSANRGVASSHMYIRHDGGFTPIEDPDIPRRVPLATGEEVDLIEFMRGLEATDLIIVRAGERRARIINYEGKWADVECYTVSLIDHCAYLTAGGDPLGYSKNPKIRPLIDGRPHSTFAWREASADEYYPDAVIGLAQIFHDGRAGDVFITTRGRYGFRKVKKGNHGGPLQGDMRVPVLMRGPTVPRGSFGVARPMDLYVLLLQWFGLDVPTGNHDGSNPFIKYKGEDRDLAALARLDQAFDETSSQKGRVRSIAGARRGRVYDLARRESLRRLELAEKLTTLLAKIETEKAEGSYDPDYADDHIAIVKRALDWTAAGHRRMVDIKKALGGR